MSPATGATWVIGPHSPALFRPESRTICLSLPFSPLPDRANKAISPSLETTTGKGRPIAKARRNAQAGQKTSGTSSLSDPSHPAHLPVFITTFVSSRFYLNTPGKERQSRISRPNHRQQISDLRVHFRGAGHGLRHFFAHQFSITFSQTRNR